MHEHERDFVWAGGAEAGTQQGHAISIRPLYRLHSFTGNLSGENADIGRQSYFQKWLRLIFYGQLDFGESFAFRGHECGDRSTLRDGG